MHEIIKIGRMTPGYGPAVSASIFNQKKAHALEQMYNRNIPNWYVSLAKAVPFFGKAIRVKVSYKSANKEIVQLYFFGFYKDEITFIYF